MLRFFSSPLANSLLLAGFLQGAARKGCDLSRITASIAALLVLPALCRAQVQFTEFNVSNAPSGYPMIPQRLTVGPDGNIWFTEYQANAGEHRIGRITTNGVITEFRATTSPTLVGPKMGFGITTRDGKLWYITETGKIARMDPLNPYPVGPYDEFATNSMLYTGHDIITGPDGNLWYTQYASIGKMTATGVNAGAWFVKANAGINDQPSRISVGPDGNLWATVAWNGVIRMTPAGVLLGSYSASLFNTERGVTTGADGRVWFADTERIAAVNMSGTVASYPVGSGRGVEWVTTGPDGNLWATAGDFFGQGLLRMDTAGVPTFYYLSNPPSFWPMNDIITGPDSCLWVAGGRGTVNGNITQGGILRACLPGPRPANITSPNPDGVYVTGNTITITVEFDTPVIVSGNPSLALNSGGTATYASGSGTNVLTFTYTVQAGETTTRLDGKSAVQHLLPNLTGRAMSVKLNGGTIRDAAANNAILLLPVDPTPGSLASNKLIAINPPDSTPPVSSATASPGPNANGWNKTDVVVAISATDLGGSGVKEIRYTLTGAQSGSQTISADSTTITISAEGVTNISYYAVDHIGNVETAKSLTISLDKTAPTVSFGTASPSANAAGWNTTSVSIPFTASDTGGSGIDSAPASPLVLSAEGLNVTGAVTVTDLAGNSAMVTSPAFKIDRTPPTIAGVRTPLPNSNNWNNTDVTVEFTCTDAGSGLAPGSPPAATILSSEGAGQSVSGACQDLAGNSASVSVTDINIDKTKPTAGASRTPAANAAGWNNTNVTVSFTGSDSLSGIASCTPDVTLGEGAGQSASGTCTDRAGNISDAAAVTGINIDKTAPSISHSRSPAANAAGWNNTNVTVTFVCSDPLSGPSPGGTVTLSAEGANQSASGSCSDQAGNSVSATVGGISIDKTPPSVAASPAPGPAWYNSAVTVGFAGVDALSGIAGCTVPVTLSADGAAQSANGACTDLAGNVGVLAAAPYNIDTTKPVISQVTADPPVVPVNSGFTLRVTVSDAASGVDSVRYNVNGGAYSPMTAGAGAWTAPVAPLPVGVYDACAKAADRAGNESAAVCALIVVYDPAGSFVSGAGSITSPAGAYPANPALTGKANFAFTSKYQNGASTPSGEMQFKLGNLTFKSTAQEWLVATGARAQFRGRATLNNSGDYGFLLTAIDGKLSGGGGVDKFRIKIWVRNPDGSAGAVVYDNQMGADDTGDSATAIENGSIVIHK